MNYYEKIKNALYDERNRQGLKSKCMVDTEALIQLLDGYERMDSLLRAQADDPYLSIEHKLHNFLTAIYHKKLDSELLMLTIMNTLKPLIEERIKRKEINNLYKVYKPKHCLKNKNGGEI